MKSYIRVGPNPNDWCFYKDERDFQIEMHRKESHVKMKAEIGVCEAKKYQGLWQPPEVRKRRGTCVVRYLT